MRKTLAILALLCLPLAATAADGFNVVFKAKGNYADVRDLVQASIEGKGLKINHTNQIAGMLERTGKDIGATKQVYENGEQFEFCSAKISREMMEADPHAIVMCPYIISVYTIPGDKTVYIAYRKPGPAKAPALKKALGDVEKLLTDIIKDAL
ncbi:MAG: DUF302 domain-containing protein [Thiobacillus sp.]|nr:DUF302 domain-containing protein [Thiobacillus sp.]